MQTNQLNLLTFPLWWYTRGLRTVWAWAKQRARYDLRATGLLLFSRHMSEPLFGDYTRSGRLVGFFLRLAILIYKLFILCVRIILIGIALLFYLVAIPLVIIMIIKQLFLFG